MRAHRHLATFVLALSLGCSDSGPPGADEATGDDAAATGDPVGSTEEDPGSTSGPTGGPPGDGSSDGSSDEGSTTGAPAGPCGTDPGLRGPVVGTIEAQGLERRFLLVVPDTYEPSTPYPLVFMLHGRGSNGEQLRLYAGVEEAAAGAAIFVYPDGLPLESMNNQTGWDLAPEGRDVAFFDALHAELTTNLCVDPERIYATGHSFGGFFSNTLGCVRGEVLRAIGPVAGGGPGAACTGQVAAWIAHGEGDAVVPTILGEGSRDYWTGANGCGEPPAATDPDPCVAYPGCADGYDVTWCLHAETGLGIGTHTWPLFAGPAIWAFFEAH